MPSVTYISTPDDTTAEITHGGVTFERGKATNVTAEQMKAGGFDTNPTFTTKANEVKEAHEADETAERKRLTDDLAELGVQHDAKASLPKLRELHDGALLAKAKA